MDINVIYFTSTGNTLWLARKARDFFREKGCRVNLYEVINDAERLENDCDIMGILYPVWGCELPGPLQDFVDRMGPGNGKKVFLIGTAANGAADTGMNAKEVIEKKGYDVIYVDHVLLPINFDFPGTHWAHWFEAHEGEKRERKLIKAESALEAMCESILAGKRKYRGKDPVAKLGGWFQRITNDMSFYKYKENLEFDRERCTRCMLCYQMCPTGNITLDQNNELQFGSTCIFCLKCYNLCPHYAALIGEDSQDYEKYRRYKGPSPEIKPVCYRQQ